MKPNSFSPDRACGPRRGIVRLLAPAFLAASLGAAAGADMFELPPTPGGVRASPTLSPPVQQGTNVLLTWYGPQGSYFVEMAPVGGSGWTLVGSTVASDYAWSFIVTNVVGAANQFRIYNYNGFVGSGGCGGCHGDKLVEWQGTHHATAYSSIASLPWEVRQNCVICHTVGYEQPTGFVTNTTTPHLTDVGCENCHGPGGAHKYGDHNITHPVVTIAAEVCGGCHDGFHHPTYEEWTNSLHSVETPDVADIIRTNAVDGPGRQMSCGPCHAGATRLAMLANYEDRMAGRTNHLTLPSAHDASSYGVTCSVCHDPHAAELELQLRNPLYSTEFYTFFTGNTTNVMYRTNWNGTVTTNYYFSNNTFANQYNPDVQICAQCHNSRGATWQGSSRPPHHSPQYNILIGAVQTNYLNGADNSLAIGEHGMNPNGCVTCHMVQEEPAPPTPANPVYTGHHFEVDTVDLTACGECHSSRPTSPFNATNALPRVQLEITNSITLVVSNLNYWATNRAPAALRPHNIRAWEYTNPGGLSPNWGTNGPSSSQQNLIPTPIKQARFNLYLVFHDGSLGVHNADYVRMLLNTAQTNVNYQLSLP